MNKMFALSKNKDTDNLANLKTYLVENKVTKENPHHVKLKFEKDADKAQNTQNIGDGKDYGVSFVVEEEQSKQEYKTFKFLTIFTVAFGLLLILFLKKLKKLTHGAEDKESVINEETEGFELADNN
jgi:hypothetical protein